jgi:SAM-dependent methyltransferase
MATDGSRFGPDDFDGAPRAHDERMREFAAESVRERLIRPRRSHVKAPAVGRRSFDSIARPTHDERYRQAFVSQMRKFVMQDLADGMRRDYAARIEPRLRRSPRRAPANGHEVRKAMLDQPIFRAFSALRYATQELAWWSVQPPVERHRDELIVEARRLAEVRTAGGTLRLDPDLPMPRELTELDIHRMPGNFHREFAEDDVSQGAVYTLGTLVAGGALKQRSGRGGVAASISRWLRLRDPAFAPRRLLDLGCSTGINLLPYLQVFPELEAHGVDVSAPLLRYAHARSESIGLPVHYSQQDAGNLDFPDASIDLVVSSFFFHEQSAWTTARVLREAFRVLRPGGLMVHMELPPAAETDAYDAFYFEWDAHRHDEPHVGSFRTLDLRDAVEKAGFGPAGYFATRLPSWGTVSAEEFREIALGRRAAPPYSEGKGWFVFGARK